MHIMILCGTCLLRSSTHRTFSPTMVKFSEWRRTRLCTSPLRFLPTTCARAQEDYTTGQRLPCRWLIGCFPRSRAAASSTKKGIGKAFMLLLAPPATLTS
ncbi:hypothetical protein RvY_16690-4 [Ramazzottius varieornatus]|uniref:Uncharacterized protein n=1 Tax=Ramazzottius varieornatus TaxID=947166 RepID=A0A1D1W5P5_RAMVA|nr:hypothetical protein RvY_16690-4 [Ramazzottius varieornatus]